MDLNLYLRVLWRFRILALIGLLLATLLALLSLVKVDVSNGFDLSYRDSEQWASSASIFITQEGFPLGRSIYDEVVPVGSPGTTDPNATSYVPRYNDPGRFASYAPLYARLASSDLLKNEMLRDGPLPGTVSASPGTDPTNPGVILPLVEIRGFATTAADAKATAARATRALVDYVRQQQAGNKIAVDSRVILRVLDEPSPPVLATPRTKTRPVFVFIAVLLAVAGLIFLLENVRPRVRVVASAPTVDVGESRRSA